MTAPHAPTVELVVLTAPEVQETIQNYLQAAEAFEALGMVEHQQRYVSLAHQLKVNAFEKPAWTKEKKVYVSGAAFDEYAEAVIRG